MSRRASVFARQNPGKRRVRFPDEVIFEDEIKEQDGSAIMLMLRRASIDINIDRINSAGKYNVPSIMDLVHVFLMNTYSWPLCNILTLS